MGNGIDYSFLFEQAFQRVKSLRDPHASRPDNADLKWDVLTKNVLFDFAEKDYKKYSACVAGAKEISISCLQAIIIKMLEINGYVCSFVEVPRTGLLQSTRFAIKDDKSKVLLLFKEIEESPYWKLKGQEPEEVETVLRQQHLNSCQYIYLVSEYAYLHVINHNSDETDPGRGHNIYSINWFFETYFGRDEAVQFIEALNEYDQKVRMYLGYILLKSLTPNALVNFRKNLEAEILGYDYDSLLKKPLEKNERRFELPQRGYEEIRKQFFNQQTYLLLLGTSSFAESLLTAEWLFNSMKKAQAIDLTVIGTGYFKAMEQLLYGLICLHRNKGKYIQRDFSRKDLPSKIELTDTSISEKAIDSTIGAMANFYKENLDMLRPELPTWAKTYIKETIFDYKDLRNGYFHKDNIHDWEKIETIRNTTFELLFLLLGSHTFTKSQLCELGIPDISYYDDYSRLCEYLNYHSNEPFFVSSTDSKEDIFIACADNNTKLVNGTYVQYSGAYIRDFGPNGRRYLISKEHLPQKVTLAKLYFDQEADGVAFSPVKVKVIFENGKYVGPPIAAEEKIDY